jgi:DNA-binding NtrC family response regulator
MLLDLKMPYISGEELLPMITADYPEIPVVVVTGSNDVDTAVKCMQNGAFDYILKPVEKSRLIGGVKRAVELRELQRENQLLKAHVLSDRLERPEAFAEIITTSSAMRSIFHYIEAIAASPRPVLMTLLAIYHFPGNIRELESMIFDAVSSHQTGKLSLDVFKAHIAKKHPIILAEPAEAAPSEGALIGFADQLPTLKQIEQLLIEEAMKRAGGNQSIAALSLGITRQALNKRLKKADQNDF